MRRALVLAAVTALALARPEMYKEKEDFQYSRSSSDEGTKSGFYGAQRGNMGGNYERAHNMDVLAQHQMGGLVRTVDGELGEGAKQKSGSVFSAANSRGVYGSGHYDLSNLEGRNFQEGTSLGDSQSHSSLSSNQAGYGSQSYSHSSTANTGYGSQSQSSRRSGYQTAGNADQALYVNHVQSGTDNLQSASDYDRDQSSSQGTGYYSQSGYQGKSVYDQAAASQHTANAYGSTNTRGAHYRLVSASPVRVYVRPGSTVTIPVAAQSFDNTQNSASTFNHNSIDSDVEALSHHGLKPTNNAKHYESSYSYRKEWEKHDTAPVTAVPLAIPTVSPFPVNSELYEDTRAQGSEHQEASAQEARNVQSSSQYRGYNVKSGAPSRHYAASTTYGQSASDVHQAASDAYGQSASDIQRAASGTYGSSASNTASMASSNTHGAYNYGAANLNSANLNSQVENLGTKPKSYQSSYSYHKSWERQGDPYVIYPSTNGEYTSANSQASQRLTSSLKQGSNYGSHQYGARYQQGHGYAADCDCDENGHIRVARSYNLHQRPSYQQSQYEGQQSQNLEDLGQQSQNLEDFEQQSQNLQDFGQQSQNLEDFGQQSQKLEDLSQQSQNLEDLGQQSQNLEDLGQQSQNLEDFGQQSQNLHDFGQETQNLEDFGQQTQDLGQQTQNFDRIEDLGQQTQNQWDQQSQTDAGQETQNTWNTIEIKPENTHSDQKPDNFFEISHPPSFRPTQPEDHRKPFSFGQTNEDHIPQETTSDKSKDVMQSEDVNQQTGTRTNYWETDQTNINHNGQNAYVPVLPFNHYPEQPDWQKYLEDRNIHIDTGYGQNYDHHHHTGFNDNSWIFNQQPSYTPNVNTHGYSSHSWVNNPSYSHPYPSIPNTGYGHTYTSTQYYPTPDTTNTYTNTQYYPTPDTTNTYTQTVYYQRPKTETSNTVTTYVNYNNRSTYETHNITETESGLTNLWNFLDETEKESLPGTDTGLNSGNWYHKEKETEQSNTHFDQTVEVQKSHIEEHLNQDNEQTNTFHQTQTFDVNSYDKTNTDKVQKVETTTAYITTTTLKQERVRPHDVERGDVAPEKIKPQEEPGRGDIGPENSSEEDDLSTKPLQIFEVESTKRTPYKTPEEIETLSLTKDKAIVTEKANSNAVPENPNKIPTEKIEHEPILTVISLKDQNIEHSELQRDLEKLKTTTPKINYGHQPKVQHELSRATSTTPRINYGYGHHHTNVEQENKQNSEQVESLDQQNLNQYQSFDQQNQQNVEQQLSDFSQQTGDFGQHPGDFGQQPGDFSQQLGDFGQQLGDFGQQPGDFDQQPGDFGQKLADFGQQTDQNKQELETFNQQSVLQQSANKKLTDLEAGHKHDIEEQNPTEFKILDQQTQGLNQDIFNQFEDLSQQTQDLGQQTQDFGQQTQDLGQQSQDFGQQSQDFGQQNEGFQQESLGDFGQEQQFHHESIPTFDQQSENINIGSKEHRQETENLEQQSQSGDLWQPDSPASQVEVFAPPPLPNDKEGRTLDREPVVEQEFVTKKATSVKESPNVDSPPEPVTEKPSFWNKVGSKFSNAKDKVKSWFSSS